ncbi:CHAD domain-containing protein [Paraburkholderia sp. SARCC-3016]|uniref:CHAD domain-containing protein n=1 Tax=Paraburkholderia sp. SARCC-3016 TaxID=3058611 RepID=UPI002806ACEF|nr:CHAD domain-containing protein [Paraburkholderia sp. SARCC-3016]MDQ7980743.1 CHAD domain-containing protein [Paraburkholderia sp. SARCC-3016]
MVRVLEIVLNLPEPTVIAWLEQHGKSLGRIDAALTEAVDALPGFERVSVGVDADAADNTPADNVAPRTLYGFDSDGVLAGAGWRLVTEATADGRRAVATHREWHAPGVAICEVVCDIALERDASLDDALNDAPHELARALGRAGELATVATLGCERRIEWRRETAQGVTVDVAFDVVHCIRAQLDPALALRELRVTTRWPGDEDDEDDEAAREAQAADADASHDAEAVTKASPSVDPADAAHAAAFVAAPAAASPAVHAARTPDAALAALFSVANELAARLPAFPVLADAFDRVCRVDVSRNEAPARAKAIDLAGARTPHRALLAIERNIADQWFGNEAAVRDAPDVEFIHQMRVAQRRLKTATKIFPAWIDDMWTTRVEPRFKWLSDLLGQARDWDVFTDSTLPELAKADVDAAAWNATREAAERWRMDARARVQEAMRSPAYAQLTLAWLEWISDLSLRGTPAKQRGRSLRSYVQKRIARHYKHVTRETKLTALDAATRHKVRIQAKRLRYTLEFFEPIVSHKTRRDAAKTLSRMQSVLGDGNDAVVALHFLEELEVPPYQLGFARGWCEALKRHTAREGERLLADLGKPKVASGGAGS